MKTSSADKVITSKVYNLNELSFNELVIILHSLINFTPVPADKKDHNDLVEAINSLVSNTAIDDIYNRQDNTKDKRLNNLPDKDFIDMVTKAFEGESDDKLSVQDILDENCIGYDERYFKNRIDYIVGKQEQLRLYDSSTSTTLHFNKHCSKVIYKMISEKGRIVHLGFASTKVEDSYIWDFYIAKNGCLLVNGGKEFYLQFNIKQHSLLIKKDGYEFLFNKHEAIFLMCFLKYKCSMEDF